MNLVLESKSNLIKNLRTHLSRNINVNRGQGNLRTKKEENYYLK